jgi:hypothetical protein
VILKTRGYYDPQDRFERLLVLCVRGPVLFEALLNSKIRFTPEEWETLVKNELDGTSSRGSVMNSLTRAPILMHHGRIALQMGTSVAELVDETGHHYSQVKSIANKLGSAYNQVRDPRTTSMRLHAQHQRMYGLMVVLIFNCILSALDPGDATLELDAAEFGGAVLALADEAAVYRPLGSSYFTLCLVTAWAACRDEAMSRMLIEVLEDYRRDFSVVLLEPLEADLEKTRRILFLLE